MSKILLLFIMIFLHIVDDYYLQGWLASAKQKEWREKNAPDELYKKDYMAALFMHSFSWAFMIMIVPSIYVIKIAGNINIASLLIAIFFVVNLFLHMLTDDRKANLKKINLIQDQSTHLVQIIVTWLLLIVCN